MFLFENYYICTKVIKFKLCTRLRTTSNDEQGLYPFKIRLKAVFKYVLFQSSEIKCHLVHRLDKNNVETKHLTSVVVV